MNKIYLLVAVIAFSLYGCGESEESLERGRQLNWISAGKHEVKIKLKDSNSAEFRNVFFNRGTDNIPMTCGEVNSKNSFGAYTGFQKFVSAGKPELTFLQEQVPDFEIVWDRLCK
jgi:hypothetical protein